MVWVVAGGVEDGDADQAAGVDWRDIIALAVADTYLIVTCWDHGVLYMALGGGGSRTVWVPYFPDELHRRRR